MLTSRRPRKSAKLVRRPMGAESSTRRTAPASTRSVLVATDGSRPASAAVKLTRIMAADHAWAPRIITVSLPLPVSVGDVALPMPPAGLEQVVNDSLVARIRQQLKRYGDAAWELRLEFGRPAPVIVEVAKRHQASLVVLGLGEHGLIGRMFGAETAAYVARHATVPVLAVHRRAWSRPQVALVAVDFSDASVRAAREALALLEPPGRLHLVHVKWSYNASSIADSAWENAYAAGADSEFAKLSAKLGAHPGIEITTSLLTGGVVDKLLHEAKSVRAELIALGSHNASIIERMMIGSTPAEVLRAAPCSVLIAPPAHATP